MSDQEAGVPPVSKYAGTAQDLWRPLIVWEVVDGEKKDIPGIVSKRLQHVMSLPAYYIYAHHSVL